VELTTEMQSFSYTFTMGAETDSDTCLEFNLGAQGSAAAVTLANVVLKETGGTRVSGNTKKVRADGNYVYNGKFQEGKGRLAYWEVAGKDKEYVSVTNENNERKLKVVAPEGTSDQNPIIIKQTGLPLAEGTYSLSFSAYMEKSDETKLGIAVGKYLDAVTLDDNSSSKYSSVITYKSGEPAEFSLVFNAPGTYYVDDIMLTEDAMVKNGSFNAGMSGFTQYTYNSAKSEFTVDSLSEDNAFAITIYDTGEEDWHVQLYQDGIKLEKGHFYRLTFKAKSSKKRTIKCTIQHNGSNDDNWDPYFSHIEADLEGEYQTFTTDFEMQADTDPVARLDFALGKVTLPIREEHSVFIDDITLVEIDKSEAKLK
ncbi:MAG: carbohydrate binding domain-containing protein, partial [Lachnospiraceae bacterium]|nr:carbohydrate binding domain-containing protein [Lachnospiraceae bacterium]